MMTYLRCFNLAFFLLMPLMSYLQGPSWFYFWLCGLYMFSEFGIGLWFYAPIMRLRGIDDRLKNDWHNYRGYLR